MRGRVVAVAGVGALAAAWMANATAARAAATVKLQSGGLAVNLDPSGTFDIAVDGTLWMEGGETAIAFSRIAPSAYLKPLGPPTAVIKGTDALGPYDMVQMAWRLTATDAAPTLLTSVRAYHSRELVAFRQAWPAGVPAASGGGSDGIIVGFPTFSTASSPGRRAEPLNFLQFGGCQLANTFTGRWSNATTVPAGPKLGLPLQLYAASMRSIVLGPGGNWLVAMNVAANQSVGCGVKASVADLPAGFEHDTFVVGGTGINTTLVGYGEALLTLSGKARPNPRDDFVLSHLGYWTDNGAFYSSKNANSSGIGNHEDALKAVKRRWIEQGIPFRYAQWDDWQWRNASGTGGIDVPGIVHWPPDATAVPDGMTNWLDMPTAQYCPMYAANNDYIAQYKWAVDGGSGSAIPLDVQFYRDLFANGSKAQMKMFEQDFLCYYSWDTNLTTSDVASGMEWLRALNKAAEEVHLPLQLCMMNPPWVLASTELSMVTNGRGTSDNAHSGAADLYPMGHSGLIMGSVGMWSSRDNVWTSPHEPGCVSNANCTSPDFRLQNVAAILGGGPYGPSDGIDDMNKEIIMSSCRADGVLLKADWPLLTLDAAFRSAFDTHGSPHVWGTHSTVSGLRWAMVLSVSLQDAIEIPLADFGATRNAAYILMDMWSTDGHTPPTLQSVQRGGSFVAPRSPPSAGDSDAGTYQALSPVLENGWCLLGEAAKVVPVSRVRFSSVEPVPGGGLAATVLAASNETVRLWLLPPTSTRALSSTATNAAGTTVLSVECSAGPCAEMDCEVAMTVTCRHTECQCAAE